jgi:Na+-transporting NADH:ubiquinone oxidoreductase subunit C
MKKALWSAIFMLLLSCVCAGVLAAIKFSTDELVAQNEKTALQRHVLASFGLPEDVGAFDSQVQTITDDGRTYWRLIRTGATAMVVSGMGFWAPIHAVIAVDAGKKTIVGIRFFNQNETPGLGGRISEPWFMRQFEGKRLDTSIRLVMPGGSKSPNDVDAITGATETSRKVEQLIDKTRTELQ